MEHSLGLSSGLGADGTAKVAVCEKNGWVEKEYMGMSKEDGLELGLGLSLGGGGGGGGGGFEYGRILTAKDFPNGLKYGRGGSGTKRERTAALSSPHQGSPAAAVSQVVGWPPIRAYRINSLFNQAKSSNGVEEDKGVGDNENNNNSKKKLNHGQEKNAEPAIKERSSHLGYVKVNMDGLPIGRKVDLNAHKSYDTLAKMLEDMFFKPSLMIGGGKDQQVQPWKLLNGSSEFVLTYEDKEGDWMLLGDVPWGMFLDTVKRVRIMRTSEANGLTPKFQEIKSSEKAKGKAA